MASSTYSSLAFFAGMLLLLAAASGQPDGQVQVAKFYPVTGMVGLQPDLQASTIQVTLTIGGGEQRTTVPRIDGSFQFLDVPPGTHLIEVIAMGYFYPPIRVDISARHNGRIHAAYSEDKTQVLGSDMLIKPVRKMQYFEERQAFNLWTFVSNPMVLMMLLSVFCVVVLSNIDPETMKEMQEQLAQQQAEVEKAKSQGVRGGLASAFEAGGTARQRPSVPKT